MRSSSEAWFPGADDVTNSTQVDSSRQVLLRSLGGVLRNVVRRPQELRYHVARELWSLTKRFGAPNVENVELRELPSIANTTVDAYIDDPNRAVLAALCQATEARTFFEIGTNRGRTAWTVARNNPSLEVHTLDLPAPTAHLSLDINDSDRAFLTSEWRSGEAFHGTAEERRITALFGDSATFDFSPWEGKVDVVFIDGAHSYSYVGNDTRAALAMLSPRGAIVWDDYPAVPGVYRFLNELGSKLDHPLYHILGTRLVIYAQQDIVRRVSDYTHLGVA